MSHHRELVNPPELHPAPGFSHIAVARGTRIVHFAGQLGIGPDFSLLADDLHGQTVGAMRNLETAMRAVGVPYTDEMIANARADAFGQAAPDSPLAEGVTKRYGEATTVRPFDGQPDQLTEMDAIVAYLQVLGRLTEAAHKTVTASGK